MSKASCLRFLVVMVLVLVVAMNVDAGLCPTGKNVGDCWCDGTYKMICKADGTYSAQPGECPTLTCPVAKTVTTGANTKTIATDRDPINMATGEYFFEMPMFNLGGSLPLTFGIYYGSQFDTKRDRYDGFPEMPFATNHGWYLVNKKTETPQTLIVELGLGKEITFTKSGANWTVSEAERYQYQLKEGTESNYYYLLDPESGLVYTYWKKSTSPTQDEYKLIRVEDRNGNILTYTENGNDDTISDGKGRQITVSKTDVSGRYYATTIKDQNNRTYTFTYVNSPIDNSEKYTLRSITDPMGNVTQFSYGGNHWITGVTYPKGNTPYTQTYTTVGVRGIVTSQTDAYGNTSTVNKVSYSPRLNRESQFNITYPDGSSRGFVHDHFARVMKTITDQTGKTANFTADEGAENPGRDQIQSITDRLGDTTTITYHTQSGNIASITNAKGQTTTYTYTAQNQTFTNPINNEQATFTFYNLTQITHPDNTTESFTYDTKGNMLTHTDQAS